MSNVIACYCGRPMLHTIFHLPQASIVFIMDCAHACMHACVAATPSTMYSHHNIILPYIQLYVLQILSVWQVAWFKLQLRLLRIGQGKRKLQDVS